MADEKKAEDFFTPPPKISRVKAFRQFVWNKRTREFLGRTAKSWVQIVIFYIILYAALAGFFSCLLIIFYQTLDATQPRWLMQDSLISTSPGVGYRPSHADPESNLISFSANQPSTWSETYAKSLRDFLQKYHENDDKQVDCSSQEPKPGQACRFDVSSLGPDCSSGDFGYNKAKPCILLKMNKIYGWKPIPYNRSEIGSLTDMPDALKLHIEEQFILNPSQAEKTIWVSCSGDKDGAPEVTFDTSVAATYSPVMGFPTTFYPFTNQDGYESPLVAVQLDFKGEDGKWRVACRLWGQNIVYDRQRRLGVTGFEIEVKH